MRIGVAKVRNDVGARKRRWKEKRRSAKAQQRAEIRRSCGQGERLNIINEPVILRPALRRGSPGGAQIARRQEAIITTLTITIFFICPSRLPPSPSLETSRRFFSPCWPSVQWPSPRPPACKREQPAETCIQACSAARSHSSIHPSSALKGRKVKVADFCWVFLLLFFLLLELVFQSRPHQPRPRHYED